MDRLHAGDRAYKDKNFRRAADEYRVACFGLLDDPPRLEEGLMRLAVAESAAGESDELESTLTRFLKVEKKIPSLDHVSVDPEIRSGFSELLKKHVPEKSLAEVPSVEAFLGAPSNPASTAQPPAPEPAPPAVPKEMTPPPVTPPTDEPEAKPQSPPPPSVATQPPPPSPSPAAPIAAPEVHPTIEQELTEARRAVLEGKSAEAEKRLARLVAENPARRDVRLALLEAACLTKEWKIAVGQVRVLSPFHDGEEPSMFYAAVALYESGARDEARVFMQRAESKITRTRYTEYYINRVLSR